MFRRGSKASKQQQAPPPTHRPEHDEMSETSSLFTTSLLLDPKNRIASDAQDVSQGRNTSSSNSKTQAVFFQQDEWIDHSDASVMAHHPDMSRMFSIHKQMKIEEANNIQSNKAPVATLRIDTSDNVNKPSLNKGAIPLISPSLRDNAGRSNSNRRRSRVSVNGQTNNHNKNTSKNNDTSNQKPSDEQNDSKSEKEKHQDTANTKKPSMPLRQSPRWATARERALVNAAYGDSQINADLPPPPIEKESKLEDEFIVSPRISSDDESSNDCAESEGTLPDLMDDLDSSSWEIFHEHLTYLAANTKYLLPAMSATTKDMSTPLHVCVWKAPPKLTLLLIALLNSSSKELLLGLLSAKDANLNLPLHLCCANLTSDTLDVLGALIKSAPSALQHQNSEGDTPLALAIAASPEPSLEGIKLLTEKYPGALLVGDVSGSTPLHLAIGSNVSSDIISFLLEASPNATSVKDKNGLLPLHYVAAFLNCEIEIVEKIIHLNESALIERTNNGDTPLHLAIANLKGNLPLTPEQRAILSLLMHCDTLAKKNNEQSTPLHICAVSNVSPDVIKMLFESPLAKSVSLERNIAGLTPLLLCLTQKDVMDRIEAVKLFAIPEALSVCDKLKGNPLHVAAQNVNCRPELIELLHGLDEKMITIQTQRGHVPIHLAAQSQVRADVVRTLLKLNPSSASILNQNNNSPLHDAAKYKASVEVVELLVKAFPEAVYIQNQFGNLPLHCAVAYNSSAEVIQLLIDYWPEGASIQNRNLDSALHYAANNSSSIEIMRALVEAAPASVLLVNSIGQTPLDRAQAVLSEADIVEFLEEATEEWQKKASIEGWGKFNDDKN